MNSVEERPAIPLRLIRQEGHSPLQRPHKLRNNTVAVRQLPHEHFLPIIIYLEQKLLFQTLFSLGNTETFIRPPDFAAAHIPGSRNFPRPWNSPQKPPLRDAEEKQLLLPRVDHQGIVIRKQSAMDPTQTGNVIYKLQTGAVKYRYSVSNGCNITGIVDNFPTVSYISDSR